MSIVSNSIINADAEARYLSPGELDQIKSFVAAGQRRVRVAQVLSEGRERIIELRVRAAIHHQRQRR
jgi:allophycocyanin alpha subunit